MKPRRAAIRVRVRRMPASLVLGACVFLLWPAQSLAAAVVRFVHAVPSAGKVTVAVVQSGTGQNVGQIAFAQTTPWHTVKSGQFEWELVANSKTIAHGTATVGSGAYDLVLLAKSNGVSLGVFKAEAGQPGTALVRVIHAAPELGSPQLRVDDKQAVASLAFTQATPYLALTPGEHTLAADPAHSTVPLLSAKVSLAADTAYSEVVVGSQGQKVQVVSLVDRGAPLTTPTASANSASSSSTTTSSATTSASTAVTVEPGDSLWQIARDRLGAGASDTAVYDFYVAIWNLNAERIGTGDPNLIFPGQRLSLPTTA